jgi:hypothetical protein
MEQVHCYLADVGPSGRPSCLAPDDPAVLPRVSQLISSCGFAVEFVIGAADDVPVPDACTPLVDCCASFSQSDFSRRMVCQMNSPAQATVTFCAAAMDNLHAFGDCKDAGIPDASPADASAGSAHALCCYRTCGSHVCT